MNLRMSLIRSFMGLGAMRLFSIPIGLLTSIILARTLGPESFGQYAFVMALLPLMSLPVAGGLPQLLTREVARYSHAGQWSMYRGLVRGAHTWVLSISLIVITIYFLCGPLSGWFSMDGKWSLMGVIILMVPLSGLNSVRNGTIKGLGFPALSELPTQLMQPVILLVAYGTLASLVDLSPILAVWMQVLSAALTFVFASILFYKIRPIESLASRPIYESRKWAVALIPFTLIVLVNTFNARVGIVLLGFLGTDEAVAAMRVGERGAQLVAISLGLVNAVISPHIVKAFSDGDKGELQQLFRKSARGAFVLAFPVALVLIVFGKSLVNIAFGPEYAVTSYLPLVVLVLGQLFNVFCGSVGQFLAMSGHERDTLLGQVISLSVNVIACTILIPLYGALGAAIGVSIGIVTWNVLLSILVVKRLKMRPTAY